METIVLFGKFTFYDLFLNIYIQSTSFTVAENSSLISVFSSNILKISTALLQIIVASIVINKNKNIKKGAKNWNFIKTVNKPFFVNIFAF